MMCLRLTGWLYRLYYLVRVCTLTKSKGGLRLSCAPILFLSLVEYLAGYLTPVALTRFLSPC